MGFDINALVLTKRFKGRIISWEPTNVLNIGRYGTMLVRDKGEQERNPRGRATLLFMDLVFDKLMKYSGGKKSVCVAPRFAIPGKRMGKRVISPFRGMRGQILPSTHVIEAHNRQPKRLDRKKDIVLADHLTWISCKLLLEWIIASETTSKAKLAENDVSARRIYDQWKDAIEEGSKRGDKVLFFFESINDPRIL